MSKVWIRVPEAATFGRNLDMTPKNANYFLGVETGHSMAGEFPKTRIQLESNKDPVDYFVVGELFIVSEDLKEVLEESAVKAEFFPVVILRPDKKKYTRRAFYFCNIRDCVACFDYERGRFTFWEGPERPQRVDAIKKLAIDESNAAGHQLFRIANGGEYIVCASNELAARVKEGGFSGVDFVAPGKWRFGMG